jgi:hypothetical protein
MVVLAVLEVVLAAHSIMLVISLVAQVYAGKDFPEGTN